MKPERDSLSPDLLHPVWVARDRRYDGKVFAGVRTTGVYCRPVCPARTALKKNMVFFPSAAAAEAAGFRPCLRCRPETSPGTPAWAGSSATVARALRLIADGWVSEHGLEALAPRLGLGERQVRRLFEQHLGAPPLAVLRTHQLDLARKLVDETRLPVAQIAFASGFESLRRFNDAFRSRFGVSPTQARAKVVARLAEPGLLRLRLSYRPPLDWEALLGFLEARAIPGVEGRRGRAYARTFESAAGPSWFSIEPSDSPGCLELSLPSLPAPELIRVVARVRALFDLDADPRAIATRLGREPGLKRLVSRHPGLRVPGAWDGFEISVRAILGQQISVAAARGLAGRLVRAYGPRAELTGQESLTHLFPSPRTLLRADLTRAGVIRARAHAIRELARGILRGSISFDHEPAQFARSMTAIRGIGEWTAGYVALRALRDPNVLLRGDLVIRRELAALEDSSGEDPARRWEPWCSYATLYLWKGAELARRKEKNDRNRALW